MELKVNLEKTSIDKKEIMKYKEQVENIHKDLHRRSKEDDDFVGWLELPTDYDKKEFKRIQKNTSSCQKNKQRLRHPTSNRNRRLIPRSKSSYRSTKQFIL